MVLLQKHVARGVGKGRWINIEKDLWEAYDGLWRDGSEENKRKRNQFDILKGKLWTDGPGTMPDEAPIVQDIARRSIWEQ